MNPTLAWVVGKGGLLGSHLDHTLSQRSLGVDRWNSVVPRFAWGDRRVLGAQLDQAVAAFAEAARAGYRRWAVLWAAGPGVVGSNIQALNAEEQTWQLFLELLDRRLLPFGDAVPGHLFLASSAGGVYGGSSGQLITEESPSVPMSDYGRSKLLREDYLKEWTTSRPTVSYLIGRISNLYGPGQNLSKPQGLISHVVRCLIHHRPVHIYVSMDTIRDFFYVEDCARSILQCLDHLMSERDRSALPSAVTKIFAAERPTSLAQIVGIFNRIAKKHCRVICTPAAVSKQQPRQLEFRSHVWRHLPVLPHTNLQVGINRVYQHQLAMYQRGLLPPPPGG